MRINNPDIKAMQFLFMKKFTFLLLFFICHTCLAQDPFQLFAEAREKARQQNYPAYLADMQKANELLPNYPDFMY